MAITGLNEWYWFAVEAVVRDDVVGRRKGSLFLAFLRSPTVSPEYAKIALIRPATGQWS